MNRRVAECFILSVVLAGCDRSEPVKTVVAPLPRAIEASDARQLVKANTAFAVALHKQLARAEGNIVVSPLSVSMALALVYSGARDETGEEMRRVMGFPLEPTRQHLAYAILRQQMSEGSANPGFELNVANALWGRAGFDFAPEYEAIVKDHFGAEFHFIDFGDSAAASNAINSWVRTNTKGKIREITQPASIDPGSRLIVTNAVFLRGQWLASFNPDLTDDVRFYRSESDSVKVPMMRQTSTYPYADSETWQAVELPYAGKSASMVFLLPRQRDGLAALERDLSAEGLEKILGELKDAKVDVQVPRFRMEGEYRLKEPLSAMGMPAVFSPGAANLLGMTTVPPSLPLAIGSVAHRAVIEVDEKGTVAAAATAIIIKRGPKTPSHPMFRADHPFLFLVRDLRTGSILFMGRLIDPLVSEKGPRPM